MQDEACPRASWGVGIRVAAASDDRGNPAVVAPSDARSIPYIWSESSSEAQRPALAVRLETSLFHWFQGFLRFRDASQVSCRTMACAVAWAQLYLMLR